MKDFFFYSSAVIPRPEFAGRQRAEDAGLMPWHFSSFYLLFSIGIGITWKGIVSETEVIQVMCNGLEVLEEHRHAWHSSMSQSAT